MAIVNLSPDSRSTKSVPNVFNSRVYWSMLRAVMIVSTRSITSASVAFWRSPTNAPSCAAEVSVWLRKILLFSSRQPNTSSNITGRHTAISTMTVPIGPWPLAERRYRILRRARVDNCPEVDGLDSCWSEVLCFIEKQAGSGYMGVDI